MSSAEEWGAFLVDSARYGDAEDVTQALASPHASSAVKHSDALGRTALHMAAANGHAAICAALLAAGADATAANAEGNTPLHFACLNGHEAVATALLKAGALPHALNKMEVTPMDEALTGDHKAIVEVLNAWLPSKVGAEAAQGVTVEAVSVEQQQEEEAQVAAAVDAAAKGTADETVVVRPGDNTPAAESEDTPMQDS